MVNARRQHQHAAAAAVRSIEGPATAFDPAVIADVGAARAASDPTTQAGGIDVGHKGAGDGVTVTTRRLAPQSLKSL